MRVPFVVAIILALLTSFALAQSVPSPRQEWKATATENLAMDRILLEARAIEEEDQKLRARRAAVQEGYSAVCSDTIGRLSREGVAVSSGQKLGYEKGVFFPLAGPPEAPVPTKAGP